MFLLPWILRKGRLVVASLVLVVREELAALAVLGARELRVEKPAAVVDLAQLIGFSGRLVNQAKQEGMPFHSCAIQRKGTQVPVVRVPQVHQVPVGLIPNMSPKGGN